MSQSMQIVRLQLTHFTVSAIHLMNQGASQIVDNKSALCVAANNSSVDNVLFSCDDVLFSSDDKLQSCELKFNSAGVIKCNGSVTV